MYVKIHNYILLKTYTNKFLETLLRDLSTGVCFLGIRNSKTVIYLDYLVVHIACILLLSSWNINVCRRNERDLP